VGRLALHASELTLKHPASGELFTVRSPLPHEFEVALKFLRKFAGAARLDLRGAPRALRGEPPAGE
jgi:hypothetical protein